MSFSRRDPDRHGQIIQDRFRGPMPGVDALIQTDPVEGGTGESEPAFRPDRLFGRSHPVEMTHRVPVQTLLEHLRPRPHRRGVDAHHDLQLIQNQLGHGVIVSEGERSSMVSVHESSKQHESGAGNTVVPFLGEK